MQALQSLRARMAELVDLGSIEMLLSWDQLVMMPADGAGARAQQLGVLARLTHERATAAEIGGWLEELDGVPLEQLDRDIVRLARRDWERASLVPEDLAVELARASTDGQASWQRAREQDDFAAFKPALERNVELARAYGECVAQERQGPYEALLSDYDFGLRTEDLRGVFAELAAALTPLVPRAWNSKRGASTCSISKLAAIAFSVSFTASVTASSEASGSAIRFVNRARVLPGASRVARPIICTISVKLDR